MKIDSRTFGFMLTALTVTSLVLPSGAFAGKRIGIPAELTGRGIHIEITQEATGEAFFPPVPPKRTPLVALATVLEKSTDSIRVVGPQHKIPVTVEVHKETVFKERGQVVNFDAVTVGSSIVIVAERTGDTWKADKIIILRQGIFQKVRITISGTITTLDARSKTVTIKVNGDGNVVLEVNAQTHITRADKVVSLGALRVRDHVRAHYRVVNSKLVAVRIRVR